MMATTVEIWVILPIYLTKISSVFEAAREQSSPADCHSLLNPLFSRLWSFNLWLIPHVWWLISTCLVVKSPENFMAWNHVKLCKTSIFHSETSIFFMVEDGSALRMLNQTSGEFGHPTFTNGPGRLPVLELQLAGDDVKVSEVGWFFDLAGYCWIVVKDEWPSWMLLDTMDTIG